MTAARISRVVDQLATKVHTPSIQQRVSGLRPCPSTAVAIVPHQTPAQSDPIEAKKGKSKRLSRLTKSAKLPLTPISYFFLVNLTQRFWSSKDYAKCKRPTDLLIQQWRLLAPEEREEWIQKCHAYNNESPGDPTFVRKLNLHDVVRRTMRVPTLADLFRTDTNSHLLDSAPLSNVSDWSSLTDAEFKNFFRFRKHLRYPLKPISSFNAYLSNSLPRMGMNVAEISGHMARKFLGLSQKQKVKLEQQAAILTGETFELRNTDITKALRLFLKMAYPQLKQYGSVDGDHFQTLRDTMMMWRLLERGHREILLNLNNYVDACLSSKPRRPSPFFAFVIRRYPYLMKRNINWNHSLLMRHLTWSWKFLNEAEREVILLDYLTSENTCSTMPPFPSPKTTLELTQLVDVAGDGGIDERVIFAESMETDESYLQDWASQMKAKEPSYHFLNFYVDHVLHTRTHEPDKSSLKTLVSIHHQWESVLRSERGQAARKTSTNISFKDLYMKSKVRSSFALFMSQRSKKNIELQPEEVEDVCDKSGRLHWNMTRLRREWSELSPEDREEYEQQHHVIKTQATSDATHLFFHKLNFNKRQKFDEEFGRFVKAFRKLICDMNGHEYKTYLKTVSQAWHDASDDEKTRCMAEGVKQYPQSRKPRQLMAYQYFFQQNNICHKRRSLSSLRLCEVYNLAESLWYQLSSEEQALFGKDQFNEDVFKSNPSLKEKASLFLEDVTQRVGNKALPFLKDNSLSSSWDLPRYSFSKIKFSVSPFTIYCFQVFLEEEERCKRFNVPLSYNKLLFDAHDIWFSSVKESTPV